MSCDLHQKKGAGSLRIVWLEVSGQFQYSSVRLSAVSTDLVPCDFDLSPKGKFFLLTETTFEPIWDGKGSGTHPEGAERKWLTAKYHTMDDLHAAV